MARRWGLAGLARPQLALLVGCVVREPDFRLAFDVEKVPVKVIPRQVELLFGRRENVAEDQAIKLPVAQVVGEIEDDSPGVEPLDRLREQRAKLLIVELIGRRQSQLGLEPLRDRQDGRSLPRQHLGQELILIRRRQAAAIENVDGLVQERLQLVAQPSVEQQLIDFLRLRVA